MAKPDTHLEIEERLCGAPLELAEGRARVGLSAVAEMAVDDRGLVHGGFVFGLADYAAMLAVNDPNVVLGAAEVRFAKPCVVGEILDAVAEVREREGRKCIVDVEVSRGSEAIFSGVFTCFVLDGHVLD